MQQYYFLFALALLWTIFASIQDLKKREVANWLNFSLTAFALSYRAFFSIETKQEQFFIFGLLGFLIFLALGNLFYYTKTFAGGDAKLLMAFGIILPYQNYSELITLSITFVFLLFLVGAIYSLVYSVFVVTKNKKQFSQEFKKMLKKNRFLFALSVLFLALAIVLGFFIETFLFLLPLFLIPIVFIYTKSLEKCMIKLYPPEKLTEGDWLEKDVKINSKTTIKKSVHGLSLEQIKLLKKHRKQVLIKEGIPFVPAFLFSLIILILVSVKYPSLQTFLISLIN